MKTRNFISLLILLLMNVHIASAQNILPLDWTINFEDSTSTSSRKTPSKADISLLLSWERQDYFNADGKCVLSANFAVNKPSSKYILSSRMQCRIISAKINGTEVMNNVVTDFWSDRKKSTTIDLPNGILKKGVNSISLTCDRLGYTGGISHNSITITPKDSKVNEKVNIIVDKKDHIILDDAPYVTVKTDGVKSGKLHFKVENDFHKQLLDTIINIKGNSSIKLNLSAIASQPGFYQCSATLHGKGYCGDVQWFGVSPEKIECCNEKSKYFDGYWKDAKAELAKIAPDFKLQKIDSLSKWNRDCYIVSMKSLNNLTVRGYLLVPRDTKKHYALLHVPGYGYGFENIIDYAQMETDRIDFALCVRGHGISADKFNPGFGVPGIWGYQLCNSDSVAYRGVYMDCVRAVDFLLSYDKVDKSRIGVTGGSQGGGLTLATAALCSDNISACAYFDPFPCDIRHALDIRRICRTELHNYLKYYGNCCSFSDMLRIQDLIDTKYFASGIKCKVCFATALFDDDCPSHQGFAAYNLITSPKQYVVYPNDSHLGESNNFKMFLGWFDKIFR